MRKALAAVLVAALAGGLAAPAVAGSKKKTIKLGDNWFVREGAPPTVTKKVRKGTKVRFKWVGDAPHNVRAHSGPQRFKSKVMANGSYTRKLRKRGTYELVCDVHPDGMRMVLKVK